MHRVVEPIWNEFDEFGLLVGLPRIPGETNQAYRSRLLGRPIYDSTKQGMINFLSNSLLQEEYNIIANTAFSSDKLKDPLSLSEYEQIEDPEVDYYQPRVIIGASTWTIVSGDNAQKDTSNTIDGVTWTLWKQPDGSYDQVWTTNQAPTADIELRYMWKDPGNRLLIIVEKPVVLSWSAGTVVEVDPDA